MSVSAQPVTTPGDRLSLTLSLAILVHAMFILGITFSAEDDPKPRFDTMEIVLVQQQSQKPEEADFLAQANLEGGGESEDKLNPATLLPAPFPQQKPEITAPSPAESRPPEPAKPQAPETPLTSPDPNPSQPAEKLVAEKTDTRESLVENPGKPEPEQKPSEPETRPESKTKPEPERKKRIDKTVAKPPTPSATKLLTNSFKIASLSAEIRRKLDARAKRPRRKFISANTQEYKYASYMDAWRTKVERVGNLNYPEAARRQNLSGSLVLDVSLNVDGSINDITIRSSSGHKVLDDAAKRIVNLASPFSPFPAQIAQETDILHIMRTWQFINNRSFK